MNSLHTVYLTNEDITVAFDAQINSIHDVNKFLSGIKSKLALTTSIPDLCDALFEHKQTPADIDTDTCGGIILEHRGKAVFAFRKNDDVIKHLLQKIHYHWYLFTSLMHEYDPSDVYTYEPNWVSMCQNCKNDNAGLNKSHPCSSILTNVTVMNYSTQCSHDSWFKAGITLANLMKYMQSRNMDMTFIKKRTTLRSLIHELQNVLTDDECNEFANTFNIAGKYMSDFHRKKITFPDVVPAYPPSSQIYKLFFDTDNISPNTVFEFDACVSPRPTHKKINIRSPTSLAASIYVMSDDVTPWTQRGTSYREWHNNFTFTRSSAVHVQYLYDHEVQYDDDDDHSAYIISNAITEEYSVYGALEKGILNTNSTIRPIFTKLNGASLFKTTNELTMNRGANDIDSLSRTCFAEWVLVTEYDHLDINCNDLNKIYDYHITLSKMLLNICIIFITYTNALHPKMLFCDKNTLKVTRCSSSDGIVVSHMIVDSQRNMNSYAIFKVHEHEHYIVAYDYGKQTPSYSSKFVYTILVRTMTWIVKNTVDDIDVTKPNILTELSKITDLSSLMSFVTYITSQLCNFKLQMKTRHGAKYERHQSLINPS